MQKYWNPTRVLFQAIGVLHRCVYSTASYPDPAGSVVDLKRHTVILRRYRKVLQDMLRAGSLGEQATLLQIIDLVPGDRKERIEVRCLLPQLYSSSRSQLNSVSLAVELERFVNTNAGEIRARVSQGRTQYKLPSFHFIIQPEEEITQSPDIGGTDSAACEHRTGDGRSLLHCVVKPTQVYGLQREHLLNKVRRTRKHQDAHKHEEYISSEATQFSERRTDPRVSAEWARVWKERQDWRTEARRERKRTKQRMGLYRLNVTRDGVVINSDDSLTEDDR
ncbi:unnamed protein product [Calicophoron daubneyi]|uniref:Uncharacterized protein n=1 Tax=Calicophoron daubneyi TaxID=300641 RepID=A0AAV2TP06_CALDB